MGFAARGAPRSQMNIYVRCFQITTRPIGCNDGLGLGDAVARDFDPIKGNCG